MTYRDDLAALTARRDALHAALEAAPDDEELARRLADARDQIDATRGAMVDVSIARSIGSMTCPASWDAMVGGPHARHCALCEKTVYDLAGLTIDEIHALFERHQGGSLCARVYRRRDGTVVTASCAPGRARVRRHLTVLAATTVLGAAAAGVASLGVPGPRAHQRPAMGEAPAELPRILAPLPREVHENVLESRGGTGVLMVPWREDRHAIDPLDP